jgi:phage terminase large subunit-like protein
VLARFWCPENRLTSEQNVYRDQYQAWARDGWLNVTPGDAVDYAFVRHQVLEDAQRFKLIDMNVDRLFQGYQLSQELIDEGIAVFGMGQGFYGMAGPMREFERRLLSKSIRHGNNPILRWMAGNVAVKQDPAGNLKPDKAESEGKIDGIVALLMALDRAMRHTGEEKSVYEERGILFL